MRVVLGLIVMLLLATVALGKTHGRRVGKINREAATSVEMPTFSPGDKDTYFGTLRVYVVEPSSRWIHPIGGPYDYGFLDFALVRQIEIPDGGTFDSTWTWDAIAAGFPGIEENNIMVMAAVFNWEAHLAYSDPPGNTRPFLAYYVDASAAASPGSPGTNVTTAGFTHSVFIEIGSMTWCPYDAQVMDTLNAIALASDYPFHHTWFVMDENPIALDRMANDYNVEFFPISFVDGGDEIILAQYEQAVFEDAIEKAGGRAVDPLSLYVSVDWLGGEVLEIRVRLSSGYVVGDADGSGAVDIDDVVYLINYIFSGGPAPIPLLAGDADCSGTVDIDDVVYLINYIFSGGPAPGDPDGDSVPDC